MNVKIFLSRVGDWGIKILWVNGSKDFYHLVSQAKPATDKAEYQKVLVGDSVW